MKIRRLRRPRRRKRLQRRHKKDRKKQAGNANAVRKDIVNFDKRQAKYKALISKAKDKEKYSMADLKIWCSVWKIKGDVVIPSKGRGKGIRNDAQGS